LQEGLDRIFVICPTSEIAANCRVGKAQRAHHQEA